MAGRKGRCENCQTKFIIEKSVVAPPKAKSSKSALMLLVLLGICLGGYWAYTQRQLPEEKKAVVVPETIKATEPKEAERVVSVPAVPSLKPLEKSFPVKTEFSKIDIREYQKTYPDVHQGWMPNKEEDAEAAKTWGSYLGPLGVRIRSHVPQLQSRPAFVANIPENIKTASGGLGLSAAEVIQIAPGSPAEGYLELGDLIIGIEGELLKSGNQYKPDWEFMHKDAREIQLMLGEKIDEAQGRGDVRLTVLRFSKDLKQRLPVSQKELWSGKGGDKATGLQTFDTEVPGNGYITLESHQFDGVNHGDGTVWMDVTVEGDYGVKKLLEMDPEFISAGYGRPVFLLDKPYTHLEKEYAQSLNLHAHGSAKWLLPEGTKRIKGNFAALSYGKVQPKVHFTNLAFPLTGIHKEKVVELRIPIGKTGSFSKTYPKDCVKSDITVTRHTEWLAAQQREDGSWPRLRGYTGDGWDTAWCALALMSSGESKYDAQVRKAAYYIAYEGAPSDWTAERTMRLIFLSEYYLRTKDEKIVAGIQAAYYQLLDCCKTDYMAGHKVNGFGYGIAGQHYGTGHMALAIAVASRTPITTNQNLVSGIIQHAGEVCVNGTYAYGRGRRLARDDSRKHSGGNAMSGPAFLGVQIGGGHQSAVKEFAERMDATIGDGDNSHASSSLAFIFSSLAIAAADEAVFLKHMQNFKYKMTIDDMWEGGFLKSAFPLDFQGGEGITSNWIRSAGSILVLNALKHNLAITGDKKHWSKKSMSAVAVSEWGGQVHSYYLRNWCIAKELLGNKAPSELSEGIKAMHALPRTLELVPKTRTIVLQYAPELIKAVASNAALSNFQKAYAIELLCGLDFKIHDLKKGGNQTVTLEVNLPFHQLNWLDEDKTVMFENSPLPLRTKVEINAANFVQPMLLETEGTEKFDLDQGTYKLILKSPLKDEALEQFDGVAAIAFKLGETTVSYKRPLKFNTDFSHSNNYNLRRFRLKLKMAPRAYYQSQPLVIAGIPFDCMYPSERMLEIQGPEQGVSVNLHEGDEVVVDLASENLICPWVHSLKVEKPSQVTIFKPETHKSISGSIEGDIENLYDFKVDTLCKLTSAESKSIIEYDFAKAVTLNGLDGSFGNCFIRVWYKQGEKWIPLVWDNYSVKTSHHPVFPDTTAKLWRVEMNHRGKMDVSTLRFYHNPNMIFKHGRLPQMDNENLLPPIQPN